MLQRLKTRWASASTKEKIAMVCAPVFAGLVTTIYAEQNERHQPLHRDAFIEGCFKSVPGMSAEAVKRYCECTADSMTPDMLASARKGTPHLTPEITQAAQACARKIADAVN